MAERSICSNCGHALKGRWLVCKYCHQAHWKMIMPYYVWGFVFLVGAWWLVNNKFTDALKATDFFSLILIIATATFAILGVVMLLMALIATLRGLFVKKMSADQRNLNISLLATTASVPLSGLQASHLSAVPIGKSFPELEPLTQPEVLELERPSEQVIFCQKCKHENAPDATHCSQCGTTLLPGAGIGERIGVFIGSLIFATLGFGAAYLLFKFKLEFGGKDWIYLAALIVFGVFVVFVGLFGSLRKIPLDERYETRAKRHVSLNAWQAIADYGSAIKTAQPTQAFDYLLERAKLYQGLGKMAEARSDWQLALENINARMAAPKVSVDLIKKRAEIYKALGMQDEYAMQILFYTIEKEKTFKTKRSDVAMGWEEGLLKGSDDSNRQELDKIRAEILANPKYKIVGQCKNCHSVVDLSVGLECTNNAKHKKITDIHPIMSEPIRP